MDAKSQKNLLYLALGAGVLYLATKNQSAGSSPDSSSEETGLLDSISTGITNVVSSITGSKVADFVTEMTPIAQQIQGTYGIDPLILISQAALESGWGKSELSAKYNNLFGFTAGSWLQKGLPVVDLPTYEYIQKPIDQVTYFETPGDIVSKSRVNDNETKVLVHRYFRKYPTWYDSAADWANLISGTSRYSKALAAAKSGDLASYASLVSAAGYATDPQYPDLLTSTGDTVQTAMA